MGRVFIDVREPFEFADAHVEGAINIPVGDILRQKGVMMQMPKDGQYIVYCRTGIRAGQAKSALERIGYTDVTNGINMEHVKAS